MKEKRSPVSFEIELTARCNNDCVHCYINKSAHDRPALEQELIPDEIKAIISQAVDWGRVVPIASVEKLPIVVPVL